MFDQGDDKMCGQCGDLTTMAGRDGSSGGGTSSGKPPKKSNNFMGFSQEEDKLIERTLL